MATYKVIQDIEAEDKLLGPLTLRQFVYAAIVVVMGFISYKLLPVSPFMILLFLPGMIFFGMLAAPFGHDQPSEVWMLAKIRFFLKPRTRIWNQDGLKELVTITVPKHIDKHLTDGLNQVEVKSRLQALASTLDSRGWAIKNVSVNLFTQPSYLTNNGAVSDRLVDVGSLPQEVPNYEVYATDDIMDERNNPTAQHLETMINQSEQAHRQAAMQAMQNPGAQAAQPPADYWFMNQSTPPPNTPPGYSTFTASPVVFPGTVAPPYNPSQNPVSSSDAEQQLLEKVHQQKNHQTHIYGHMKVLQPIDEDSSDGELGYNQPVSGVGNEASTQAPQPTNIPTPRVDVSATADRPISVTSPDLVAVSVPEPDFSADSGSAAPVAAPQNPAIQRLASNSDLNVATLAREAKKADPTDGSGTLTDEVVLSFH